MGAEGGLTRVVFDTNTVVSALLFGGTISWLVEHWRTRVSRPLVSPVTAGELLRVLHYPKFGLTDSETEAFAARYLLFAERIDLDESVLVLPRCRDPKDRAFLALAEVGQADVLVTGDVDLLVLRGQTRFAVESPVQFRARFA